MRYMRTIVTRHIYIYLITFQLFDRIQAAPHKTTVSILTHSSKMTWPQNCLHGTTNFHIHTHTQIVFPWFYHYYVLLLRCACATVEFGMVAMQKMHKQSEFIAIASGKQLSIKETAVALAICRWKKKQQPHNPGNGGGQGFVISFFLLPACQTVNITV